MTTVLFSIRDIDLNPIDTDYYTMSDCIVRTEKDQYITIDFDGEIMEVFNYKGHHICSMCVLEYNGKTLAQMIEHQNKLNEKFTRVNFLGGYYG